MKPKPHIKLVENSCVWQCVYRASTGYGFTPAAAYDNLRAHWSITKDYLWDRLP